MVDPHLSPFPAGPSDPPPRRRRGDRVLLATAVLVVAVTGLVITVATGRTDSALLFVGVPCLLALGVGLLPSSDFGTVCQVVTVALLLLSAVLHEGAVCVLLVSPVVYAAAGAAYLASGVARRPGRRHALAAPVLLLVAIEGVVPGARVDADQRATAERTTDAGCAAFVAALERGPAPRPEDRGWLLSTTGYPSPETASGEGLAVGDAWRLGLAAGEVQTVVVASEVHEDQGTGRVVFDVATDTSQTARTVTLHRGTVSWAPDPRSSQRCRTRLDLDYTRRLDPSLWFGPITGAFMDRGAQTFLRGLD